MTTKMKAAFACHLIAIIIVAAFGVTYSLRSEFMPYHSTAVGLTWAEVDPRFQIVILALMRAIGGACLAVVVLAAAVLFGPFRRGEMWAKWVIPVGGLIIAAGALYAMFYVAAHTPATPPWIAPAVGAVLLLVGLVLSLAHRR